MIRLVTVIAGLALLSATVSAAADAATTAEPQAAIEYLLARVADSELEFVRNGKAHPGPAAAKHMRRKYEYYAGRIHSPEDFIELVATKSMLSGKQYLVSDADGTMPTAEWLYKLLVEYRDALDDRVADAK